MGSMLSPRFKRKALCSRMKSLQAGIGGTDHWFFPISLAHASLTKCPGVFSHPRVEHCTKKWQDDHGFWHHSDIILTSNISNCGSDSINLPTVATSRCSDRFWRREASWSTLRVPGVPLKSLMGISGPENVPSSAGNVMTSTLWLCQNSYWKWPIYRLFTCWTWWFSIAMLNYQRVCI